MKTSRNIWSLPDFTNWLKKNLEIEQTPSIRLARQTRIAPSDIPEALRISGEAILRQGIHQVPFTAFGNLFQRPVTCLKPVTRGHMVITLKKIYFIAPDQILEFPVPIITCITTNSNFFEFKIRQQPVFQVQFLEESPLKYEFIFQKLLDRHYQAAGKKILEYQPSLRFGYPSHRQRSLEIKADRPLRFAPFQLILTRILLFKIRVLLRSFIQVTVHHRNLLPQNYPYISLANHQSIFDPFIILAFTHKEIGFLTKSTSFCHFFERFMLKLGKAIPTTRYQTDPAVIYHIRTFLSKNITVGIFPEGERCWDGRMQPFKISVIRLLLQLRIPVVPIITHNSFKFFPRWARFPERAKVDLEICAPFCLVPDIFSLQELKGFVEKRFREALDQKE